MLTGRRTERDLRAEVHRLQEESHLLRARLRRVAVALAMTEELRAITYRRLAVDGGPGAEQNLVEAKRADEAAETFRDIARHIED